MSDKNLTKNEVVKTIIKRIGGAILVIVISYLVLIVFSQPGETFATSGAQAELQRQLGTKEASDFVSTIIMPLIFRGAAWLGMITGAFYLLRGFGQLINNVFR